MSLEDRLARFADRFRAGVPLPLRLELWNGHYYDLAGDTTVKITVPKPGALRYFFPPDLNKLDEAFVEGHIRVEGSMDDVFRVAAVLASTVSTSTGAGASAED